MQAPRLMRFDFVKALGRRFWRGYVSAPTARAKAGFLAWTGRPEEAEIVLREAAAGARESFAAHVAHGRALLALGREADALEAFGRARRIAPLRFLRRREIPPALREIAAVSCAAPALGPEPKREAKTPKPPDVDGSEGSSRAPRRSDAEARRFQALGPLDMTSAKNVDWDDLLSKLADAPPSIDGDAV
jgi:tetratricopeptide (TPR) repeat protein